MRVRRSAMGSVMLMRPPSPARLREARNLAAHRDLADLLTREAELAVHAARAARDIAAVAQARGARVPRHRLQPRLGSRALLRRRLGITDRFLELRAPQSVPLHDPRASLLALDHVRLRHRTLTPTSGTGS